MLLLHKRSINLIWFYIIATTFFILGTFYTDYVVCQPVVTTGTWNPMGNAFVGNVSSEGFGTAVTISADGTIIAAASLAFYDSDISEQIQVRKYNPSTKRWEPMGSPIPGNWFVKLSADGTTIIVQYNGLTDDGLYTINNVRVYKFMPNINDWKQIGQTFPLLHPQVDISADGTIIAIAPNTVGAFSAGVSVYKLLKSPYRWELMGDPIKLIVPGQHQYGDKIALSANGTRIVVSDDYIGEKGYSGQVRVLQFHPLQSRWIPIGSNLNTVAPGAHVTISSDGTIVGVSPFYKNISTYKYSVPLKRWVKLGRDIENNGYTNIALSGDGTTMAIANEREDHVYKFHSSPPRWVPIGLNLTQLEELDSNVAISRNGKTVIVGSPYVPIRGVYYTGRVRVYKYI